MNNTNTNLCEKFTKPVFDNFKNDKEINQNILDKDNNYRIKPAPVGNVNFLRNLKNFKQVTYNDCDNSNISDNMQNRGIKIKSIKTGLDSNQTQKSLQVIVNSHKSFLH